MEQSMTMSMISSMTPDDFQNEEDVFGKRNKKTATWHGNMIFYEKVERKVFDEFSYFETGCFSFQ